MIVTQTGRFLVVFSLASCQSRYAIRSKNFFCPLRKTSSNKLPCPGYKRISLHQTCPITGSAKLCEWLKREERKEYYLTAEEFKTAIDNDEVYVVDVREPFEVENGRVPAKRYVNIPMGIVSASLKLPEDGFKTKFKVMKPQKNDQVIFMCRGGIRSTFCLGAGQDLGYKNSKHYLGGWNEWEATYPMLKK